MERSHLLQYFEALVDTPGAVAKLRAFVLQLAVGGELAPQNSEDEKLPEWRSFAFKFPSAHEDGENGQSFPLPKSWRWVRLRDVAEYGAGTKVEPLEIDDTDWVLDLEEIEKDMCRILRFAKFREKQSTSTKAKFQRGDVLYGKLRPYLNKVVVAPQPGFCTTEIVPIRSRGIIVPEYLCVFLRSPDFVDYANSKSYGMKMPRLGTEDAEAAWIAVPPPGEQRRIVAKVEELLALCGELEARQTAARGHRTRLARSALDHLTSMNGARVCDPQQVLRTTAPEKTCNVTLPSNRCGSKSRAPQDDFRRYADFVLNTFPDLTSAPDDVPSLRQALLSLAVHGCLVPQNGNDKDASRLYNRIESERAKQQAEGPYKSFKPLPPVEEPEKAFALPLGWGWFRLRNLVFTLGDGLHGTPEYSKGTDCHFINGNNLVNGRIVIKPQTKTVSLAKMQKHRRPMTLNTVLVSINGTLGSVAFYNNENVVLGKSVCYFNLTRLVDKHFMRLVCRDGPHWSCGRTLSIPWSVVAVIGELQA